jgi:Fe-S-cluster containining protein
MSSVSEVVQAGPFRAWLAQFKASLRGEGGTDVPCGTCVGCCVSGYPVPIRPTDALDDVLPREYVVQVSSISKMMVARDDGTCPMLQPSGCLIYSRRPQTCRDYDCRVFAAAGIDAGGPDRRIINERVRAWNFTYEDEEARRVHEAVKATARFIRQSGGASGQAPSPGSIAVLSIKAYEVFLDRSTGSRPPREIAAAIIAASKKFDLAT